jgi:hypothetical protein
MSKSSASSVASNRHPWDIHLKPGEDDRLRPQLVQPIGCGLIAAGATLKHARGGRLRPVHGLYHIHAEGKAWAFRLFPYCHLRWLWRITVGIPSRDGFGLLDAKEFSLLDEQISEQTGRDLAALIRAIQKGETPACPMFDHDPSFPRYAWSNAATERYEDWRKWREASEAAARKPVKAHAVV